MSPFPALGLKHLGFRGSFALQSGLVAAAVLVVQLQVATWLSTLMIVMSYVFALLCLWAMKRDNTIASATIRQLNSHSPSELSKQIEQLSFLSLNGLAQIATQEQRQLDEHQHTLSELLHSAKELNQSSELLAGNALQQSDATGAIAAAITEISHSLDDVSQNTLSAKAATETTRESGSTGAESLRHVSTNTEQTLVSLSETQRILEELTAYAKGVSEATDMISSIAEQTNLLALNAAIESARAGDHGRGFSVVATEVRNLATSSHQSAEQISTRITGMTDRLGALSDSVTSAIDQGKNTIRSTEESLQLLSDIDTNTHAINQLMEVISHATGQQSMAAREISEQIEAVALAATQNSKVATESCKIANHLYHLCQNEERSYA